MAKQLLSELFDFKLEDYIWNMSSRKHVALTCHNSTYYIVSLTITSLWYNNGHGVQAIFRFYTKNLLSLSNRFCCSPPYLCQLLGRLIDIMGFCAEYII